MRVHVLYFYQEIDNITQNDGAGLIVSSPLVASIDKIIKSSNFNVYDKVRPFELQQDRLIGVILNANSLGIKITNIEFTEEIDPEIDEEMLTALAKQDIRKFEKILLEVTREFHIDIYAISYIQDGRHYRLTKHAVAEIPAEYNELPKLAFSAPIAYAAGVSNFPLERY